jgi:AmmeMemoRadiSam system protein B
MSRPDEICSHLTARAPRSCDNGVAMVDARKPAAAGVFYPADSDQLATLLRALLEAAGGAPKPAGIPARVRAIVVPHGIFGVAGSIAAAAWTLVGPDAPRIDRVLVLGPAHHVPFAGIAAPFADSFSTPLGDVTVDRLAIEGVRHFPQVVVNDLPHEQEPSLEAQLPLLQMSLPGAVIIPLVVGEVTDDEGAQIVEALWNDRTLVVVSTDLSRYFDAATAGRLDDATARAIERLDVAPIGEQQACGHAALRALMLVARARGLQVVRLALGHSGSSSADQADQSDVVGFGAFVLG